MISFAINRTWFARVAEPTATPDTDFITAAGAKENDHGCPDMKKSGQEVGTRFDQCLWACSDCSDLFRPKKRRVKDLDGDSAFRAAPDDIELLAEPDMVSATFRLNRVKRVNGVRADQRPEWRSDYEWR